MFKLILIVFIIVSAKSENEREKIDLKFPKDFLVGAASSGYQIEGAWNVSDKAISNWDDFVHTHSEKIDDSSTGDVACDSYHKLEEDLDILKNLSMNHYRFSLRWSRILPKGHAKYISRDGLKYYHKILDGLEKRGIIPFVTIYHWDHPNIIEKSGGWLNDEMPYWYANYAKVVFEHFAHRVKFFVTLNEPSIFCTKAYVNAVYPPGRNLTGTGEYACLHNILKANALAYHMYNNTYRKKYNGKIGIVLYCKNYYSSNKNDKSSNETAFEFECGWPAHPIFSATGDYPKIMKQMVAKRSQAENYFESRLPKFSKSWIKYIKGTADFFGLNHYTSFIVEPVNTSVSEWPNDAGLNYYFDPKWPDSQSSWLKVVPKGLGDLLRTIKNKYNNPPIYITENGVTDGHGINDIARIRYLYSYMKEVLIAMKRDKCDIKAYTVWSLLDSFEWEYGYTTKFGLIEVNFQDPNRTRTFKKSAEWLKNVLHTRELHIP